MTRTARDRAERCFALARSTTFEGERANAIAQGTRIAETAGLSLDDFDIPGRVRQHRRQPGENVQPLTVEQIDELMRKMGEVLNKRFDAAYARTYHDPRPQYCPHGGGLILGRECGCPMCERDRRSAAPPRDLCPKCGNERVQSGFFSVCGHCS